jgi:hypothetical protein
LRLWRAEDLHLHNCALRQILRGNRRVELVHSQTLSCAAARSTPRRIALEVIPINNEFNGRGPRYGAVAHDWQKRNLQEKAPNS